jgi:zinc transport system substrate-binding protein
MAKFFLIIGGIFLISCGNPARPPAGAGTRKPVVYVTNYPLQFFASRIGGDLIEVHFPAPPEVDPAYWEPGAAAIEAFQKADLILLNGASYEKWIERTSLPLSKVTDTSAPFKDQYIPLAGIITHTHGPEGKHSHGGTAFTTWLDPVLATEQAKSIRAALGRMLPHQSGVLEGNYVGLAADLSALDKELKAIRPGPLVASHPVYQYLARRYTWSLESVHWEPDEMPSEAEWHNLQSLLKKHRAKAMLWEARPRTEIEARLEKLGVQRVVFEPCANVPGGGHYLTAMRQNVERLKRLLQ